MADTAPPAPADPIPALNRACEWILVGAFCFYLFIIALSIFLYEGQVYFTLIDDAMISLRHARNLAAGHGFVWNPGEPPVEGYTNFLWMLWMAAWHRAGVPPRLVALPILLTGAGILLAFAWMMRGTAWRLAGAPAAAMALVACAFYYPLVFWTLRGMEVGLLCLIVYAAADDLIAGLQHPEAADNIPRRACVLAPIGVFVREDAALAFASMIGMLSLMALARRGRGWKSAAALAGSLAGGLIALHGARWAIFGEWMPNTYYLKMTGVPLAERAAVGWEMLLKFGLGDVLPPLALLLLGMAWTRRADGVDALFLTLFLGQLAYSVYAGGDYAEHSVQGANRFALLGVPALFLGAARRGEDILRRAAPWAIEGKRGAVVGLLGGLALIAACSGGEYLRWARETTPYLKGDTQRAKLGLVIRDSTAPNAVLGVHAAGNLPYFADRKAIDMLGKNDAFIAQGPSRAAKFLPGHNKWDYDDSISRIRPDIVIDSMGPQSDLVPYLLKMGHYVRTPNDLWLRRDTREITNRPKLLSAQKNPFYVW
jgi:hypothetical protein